MRFLRLALPLIPPTPSGLLTGPAPAYAREKLVLFCLFRFALKPHLTLFVLPICPCSSRQYISSLARRTFLCGPLLPLLCGCPRLPAHPTRRLKFLPLSLCFHTPSFSVVSSSFSVVTASSHWIWRPPCVAPSVGSCGSLARGLSTHLLLSRSRFGQHRPWGIERGARQNRQVSSGKVSPGLHSPQ